MQLAIVCALIAVCLAAPVRKSVFLNAKGEFEVVERVSESEHFLAGEIIVGSFDNAINTTGWSFLSIRSNPEFPDNLTAAAAGFYEGQETPLLLEQTALNSGMLGYTPSPALAQFLAANSAFMSQQIAAAQSLPSLDPKRIYWYHVNLILTQLNGLYEGYQNVRGGKGELTLETMLFLNLGGDMEDLANVFGVEGEFESAFFENGHCSALLRLLPDGSDVFIAQATWSSMNSMLRTYKMYDFDWSLDGTTNDRVPGTRTAFSAYPGSLFSGDDFYVLSSGLVVQETTIGYDNPDLNQYIVPESVLEWMRNMLANRLGFTGAEWIEVYSQYNSGTYNNQNMILDYKQFRPGHKLTNGTFWLCEQVPGYIRSNDLSDLLQTQGYYGSYNAAYDPVIRNVSGSDADEAKFGPWFSYNATARALIFARGYQNVTSMEGMEWIMRYNDFKNDPLSSQLPSCQFMGWTNCTPAFTAENAIAARDDLNPADGVYVFSEFGFRNHAAVDAKISSFSTFDPKGLYARAQSGPTYYQQPVFQFSTSPLSNLSYAGLPDRWEFPWVDVSW
eukprot:m.401136 g.401136  ORF g.401136 m.401136 type:complete len:559 (+) comp56440_c0_seq2:369-2045(+)